MRKSKRPLYPLYTESDREAASGILKSLEALGFTSRSKTPKKSGVLLLFLSEAFQKDEALQAAFLSAYSKNIPVIPVSLDESSPPEGLKDALYAYNTIYASRYSEEELAARIASAEVLQKKNRLPVLIAVSAGLILLLAGGIILWRLLPKKERTPVTEEAESTEAPVIPEEAGISAEDLEKVYELLIVGDQFFYTRGDEEWVAEKGWARVGTEYLANRNPQEDNGRYSWYSTADGHEIEMTRWEDLDFLKYMKNMKFLSLVRVDGTLPDLTGLEHLENVEIMDCDIQDVSGAAAPKLQYFSFFGDYVPDLSFLNSSPELQEVYFHMYGMDVVDLSDFGPPSLRTFRFNGNYSNTEAHFDSLKNCTKLSRAVLIRLPNEDLSFLSESFALEEVGVWELWNLTNLHGLENKQKLKDFWTLACLELSDLSALSDASSLQTVDAEDIRAEDLSWLSGAEALTQLELRDSDSIRSFHGLENHRMLKEIRCERTENLTDISALRSCDGLETLRMWDIYELQDISAVVSLPKLHTLELYGYQPDNVDFLYDLQNKDGFSFGVSSVEDWSGLQAVTNYDYLNITSKNGTAFPYLRNASIRTFEFFNRRSWDDWGTEKLDFSDFPEVTEELKLHGIPSFEGFPSLPLKKVEIHESPYLASLNGLQNLTKFGKDGGELFISGVPRLSDWSALDGMQLSDIQLRQTFSLPEFSRFFSSRIEIEEPVGLKDLHCFDGMTPEKSVSIRLVDTTEVKDLSPLFTMTTGFALFVPAHLQAQAEALVESGVFKSYEISYPLDEWELEDIRIRLTSLEELETLPEAALPYVREFAMAGDQLFHPDEYWVDERWDGDSADLFLVRQDSDEEIPVEDGTMLRDLSMLSKLTGLESLQLYRQPLTDLDGIQVFSKLQDLRLVQSPAFTDASAAFSLQGLRHVDFRDTSLESIQGIQNLYELEDLNLDSTKVTDFSPLQDCPEELNVRFQLPLMSIDEFEKLPEALISRLTRVAFAGGYAGDPWSPDWYFEEDWSTDPVSLYIHLNDTDERIPITEGGLTDLTALPDMPRLETLVLQAEPLESLDGIERFSSLQQAELRQCRKIEDISALFDLPEIREISAENCTVRSIEGIEKVKKLTRLHIGGTELTDLTPLREIDFSFCREPDEGSWIPNFDLGVDNLQDRIPDEQYELLSCVPSYDYLNIFNTDCRLWMNAVKDTPIRQIEAGNCGFSDELLREFVEAHPELQQITLSWNQDLHDLTPLLSLPELRHVRISGNMEAAIRSLGEDPGFELEIE